jgi:hypothetical protein
MMAKRIYVTGAQKDAAQMLVERGAANGAPASDTIKKIANARPAAITDKAPSATGKGSTGGGEVRKSGRTGGFRSSSRPAPDAT